MASKVCNEGDKRWRLELNVNRPPECLFMPSPSYTPQQVAKKEIHHIQNEKRPQLLRGMFSYQNKKMLTLKYLTQINIFCVWRKNTSELPCRI